MVDILFAGCSFVEGMGLPLLKQDPQNFCNVFANQCFEDNHSVTNIGRSGNSNLSIYLSTSLAIAQQKFDYVFIGWSAYPRYNFRLGFETYDFGSRINFNSINIGNRAHAGHKISYSKKWIDDFREKYLLAHHPHFEAVELMKYITLLDRAADRDGIKLYYINNLCPWTPGYFDRQSDFMPANLDTYTQELLEVDSRDDSEIVALYNRMHDDFEQAGGIKSHRWINLYQSFNSMQIDRTGDKLHPGPQSHEKFGKFLADKFSRLDKTLINY
jgi:hypothetical protein